MSWSFLAPRQLLLQLLRQPVQHRRPGRPPPQRRRPQRQHRQHHWMHRWQLVLLSGWRQFSRSGTAPLLTWQPSWQRLARWSAPLSSRSGRRRRRVRACLAGLLSCKPPRSRRLKPRIMRQQGRCLPSRRLPRQPWRRLSNSFKLLMPPCAVAASNGCGWCSSRWRPGRRQPRHWLPCSRSSRHSRQQRSGVLPRQRLLQHRLKLRPSSACCSCERVLRSCRPALQIAKASWSGGGRKMVRSCWSSGRRWWWHMRRWRLKWRPPGGLGYYVDCAGWLV